MVLKYSESLPVDCCVPWMMTIIARSRVSQPAVWPGPASKTTYSDWKLLECRLNDVRDEYLVMAPATACMVHI